ncbi:MAG: hypothetical protein JOS17DRAFT_778351 [Linnemannia elongata]|nr:MAG: hypothetical protein JOS17DRAFT_778351 [Linnemannia elongata]
MGEVTSYFSTSIISEPIGRQTPWFRTRKQNILAIKVPETKTFQDADSKFGVRANLPPTASIKYEIQCGNAQPIALEESWRVVSLVKDKFSDVKSFVQNVCEKKLEPAGADGGANALRDEIKGGSLHMIEEPVPHLQGALYC